MLALRLASEERLEVLANGFAPRDAMVAGLLLGPSFGIVDQRGDPIGAFGYTPAGVIWSLWGNLSKAQSWGVLEGARQWIPQMVSWSGLPHLHNVVSSQNEPAITWIKATRTFWMDTANPRILPDGSEGFYFETLPRAQETTLV